MNWRNRTAAIQVGDKVYFSKKFLQSTGQQTGETPFARGVVTAIIPLGDIQLAAIKWDNADMPERINVANLSCVTEKGVQESP